MGHRPCSQMTCHPVGGGRHTHIRNEPQAQGTGDQCQAEALRSWLHYFWALHVTMPCNHHQRAAGTSSVLQAPLKLLSPGVRSVINPISWVGKMRLSVMVEPEVEASQPSSLAHNDRHPNSDKAAGAARNAFLGVLHLGDPPPAQLSSWR